MKKLLTILIGIIILIPTISHAQGDLKLTVVGDIKPNGSVVVRLSSPYRDLGGTDIMWLENDKVVEDGIGMITHRVELGNFGEPIVVTAILAIEGSQGLYRDSVTISPAVIDLLWEAQTAVPPFYRGKALPSHESLVKTLAIPYFGTSTPSSEILYSWKKDKTVSIGDGVNVISSSIFGAWENKSTEVKVSAKFKDQEANGSIKIPSFKPALLFYEISPLQGILTQEVLNNSPIRNSIELSLLAVPFGFANNERNKSQILYEWTAGSSKIKEGRGTDLETISLSRSDSKLSAGEIIISLLAQNTVNVMQYSNSKFSWKFTNN